MNVNDGSEPCPTCHVGVPHGTIKLHAEINRLRARFEAASKVIDDLFSLVATSSRWFHDSTMWESDEEYLGPMWEEIRTRAAAVQHGEDKG